MYTTNYQKVFRSFFLTNSYTEQSTSVLLGQPTHTDLLPGHEDKQQPAAYFKCLFEIISLEALSPLSHSHLTEIATVL